MSRRDYLLIAKVIREAMQYDDNTVAATVAVRMAQELATDNPRFDQHKFLVACGYINPSTTGGT